MVGIAADVLVPVSAQVQPTMMVIQVLDSNGVETARLTVPASSRVVTFIQGGTPTPAPFPKPNPQPMPTPGVRKIIILEQSEDRTPEQAAVLTSPELREYLESKGHSLRITDLDSVPTGTVPSSPLPLLVIEDGVGNAIYQGVLPATVDATLTLIKAHGG